MWVFDEEAGMIQREITYVPGLYKIFDEILGTVTKLNVIVPLDWNCVHMGCMNGNVRR